MICTHMTMQENVGYLTGRLFTTRTILFFFEFETTFSLIIERY